MKVEGRWEAMAHFDSKSATSVDGTKPVYY